MLDAVFIAGCSSVKFFFLFVCGSNRVFGGIPTGKQTELLTGNSRNFLKSSRCCEPKQ